jgi:2,3-dihydroxy-p-cumate/2,3-dihydroxybenzoate 3,4-dioxygenase
MIRYSKLGYVALNVSDLGRARDWYASMMGLQVNGAGETGELYFRAGPEHHSLVLHEAATPGLKRVGWELESDAQFDVVARELGRHGIGWRELDAGECRAAHIERAVRMVEPVTGVTLEFYGSGMQPMDTAFAPTVAKLQSICHVGIGTPRYREAIEFYERVLNFRTSDEIDGRINLMRCFPNPLHHSLAIAHADRNSLHHVNFMVSDDDDLQRARARFHAHGVPMVWDGFHPPSGNTFLFFLDPDGLSLEYGYGMELFPENGARAHRVFPARPESFDSTGSARDGRMAAAGDIEPGLYARP